MDDVILNKPSQLISKSKIETAVSKLVEAYKPATEEIYLFGSYAWGSPDQNSDLDFLVIVSDSDIKPYKRPVKGIRALRGMKIPKDIIVYTQEEFEKLKQDKGSFCYKIIKEGEKVYEA